MRRVRLIRAKQVLDRETTTRIEASKAEARRPLTDKYPRLWLVGLLLVPVIGAAVLYLWGL